MADPLLCISVEINYLSQIVLAHNVPLSQTFSMSPSTHKKEKNNETYNYKFKKYLNIFLILLKHEESLGNGILMKYFNKK
jgi:hypothetical protein